MEVLPGVFKVASFIISINDWLNIQPCLVKDGYRYQLIKDDKQTPMVLIQVLKVTEYAPDDTKEFMNDYI